MTDTKHSPHPSETPEYWRQWARAERAAAASDRKSRHATVESIRVHEQNALDYDARADALEGKS